jgi:hypothetical protein
MNLIKYRVKQDIERGVFYPQRRILGIWLFYYDGDGAIYRYSVETAFEFIQNRRNAKRSVQYEYKTEISCNTDRNVMFDVSNYRVKKVINKDGRIRFYPQIKFLGIWKRLKSKLRNINDVYYSSRECWVDICWLEKLKEDSKKPKVQYHYPELSRKDKLKLLK